MSVTFLTSLLVCLRPVSFVFQSTLIFFHERSLLDVRQFILFVLAPHISLDNLMYIIVLAPHISLGHLKYIFVLAPHILVSLGHLMYIFVLAPHISLGHLMYIFGSIYFFPDI